MISHLGINPDKGGNPANERKARGAIAGRIENLDQEVARVFRESDEVFLNIRNTVRVIGI